MSINDILQFIGMGLIVLGGLSGAMLFLRAAIGKAEGGSTSTLWGLFLLGLVCGTGLLLFVAYG
ncbi:hypothetical protein U14_03586 [Candidatus Moduliflexus flocculans]|uniref:Uncharacterized protein n=1 Tax=Candidatus Moduliflexus flocculans TaxID=1499966 RepID=A0A081BPL9_9BACT|nr:hypothetical protein U14_03586 [Candidatus Moduliflexus flocculans]